MSDEIQEDPALTEAAEAEVNAMPDFESGEKVWVADSGGTHHPGTYIGRYSAGWFGRGPSALVLHELGHHPEVVSLYRITPRD